MYTFIDQKEIEKIILEHILNTQVMEEHCEHLLQSAFDQMISRLLLQIKVFLEKENHLKRLEIYYRKMKEYHASIKEYIGVFDAKDLEFDSTEDRRMAMGILEAIEDIEKRFPKDKEDPLEYERTLLISLGLLKIKEAMNHMKDKAVKAYQFKASVHKDYIRELKKYMLVNYREAEKGILDMVTETDRILNDYSKRKELGRYVNFMEEMENLLKNFVDINLDIIGTKEEVKHLEMDEMLTAKYIYPLRRIYQEIEWDLHELRYVKEHIDDMKLFEVKDIDRIIEDNIFASPRLSELIKVIEEDKNDTFDRLKIRMRDELNKVIHKELERLKKKAYQMEFCSYRLIELLEETLMYLNRLNITPDIDDKALRIAKGILDTLFLKYDLLKEEDGDYHMKKKEAYLRYEQKVLNYRYAFDKRFEENVEMALANSMEGFHREEKRFTRIMADIEEDDRKKDEDYLKKVLLVEIRTLEDLITHSISVLENYEDEVLQEFSTRVRTVYQRILNQLEENEVKAIHPKEGQSFDGKRQEILMTEESQTYKKGTILRCANIGFTYGEQVIMRASVIVSI